MVAEKYLQELHAELLDWKNKLAFYKDDLKIMKDLLGQVSAKNSDMDIHAMVERFQNKMIIQKEQIDILRHEVKAAENIIEENIEQNPTATDHKKASDHSELRDKVDTFELLFNVLRKDLNTFTSRWM